MIQVMIAALVLVLFLSVMTGTGKVQQLLRLIKHKFKINNSPFIFGNNYIEVKSFFVREFNATPCINFINDLDGARAFEFISNGNAGKVLAIYQRNYYNWQEQEQQFITTVFVLEGKVMIELGDDYAEVLFTSGNYDFANKLLLQLSTFKAPGKSKDFEINIITQTSNGLDLKQLAIKPTTLDIGLYYNDDFKEVDEIIKARLAKENDKGIILLHGLPGTGKTTYLRHLIGSINKRVLFVSPGVAGNLVNPEFIDLLIDNPNALLVIEDAENIIMDRKYNSNSSVSNLLNISDGLLSDCLNVQIICTFNSALSMVDNALLRKGRLIAKYEFQKLSTGKAQQLSDHLGFDNKILRPMTIAEIANPGDMDAEQTVVKVLGFRREEELMIN